MTKVEQECKSENKGDKGRTGMTKGRGEGVETSQVPPMKQQVQDVTDETLSKTREDRRERLRERK